MSARKLVVTILALLILGVVVMAMPWTRDMVAGPAVLPQERPMLPPPGVLSVGGEPILDRFAAREQMTNPLASSPRGAGARQVAVRGVLRCLSRPGGSRRRTSGNALPEQTSSARFGLHPAVRRRVHVQHPSRGRLSNAWIRRRPQPDGALDARALLEELCRLVGTAAELVQYGHTTALAAYKDRVLRRESRRPGDFRVWRSRR